MSEGSEAEEAFIVTRSVSAAVTAVVPAIFTAAIATGSVLSRSGMFDKQKQRS